MNDREASVTRAAMDLVAKGLIRPGVFSLDAPVDNLTALEWKVNTIATQLQLLETIRLTDEALSGVSQALVDAHHAAARIEVHSPTDQQVQDFKRALEVLHGDIQRRQGAHAVVNLIVSLKRAIPELA